MSNEICQHCCDRKSVCNLKGQRVCEKCYIFQTASVPAVIDNHTSWDDLVVGFIQVIIGVK